MAYGTAPRLVNGKWTTRTGRVLSAKGQTYWSNLHAQGRTDGQGHISYVSTAKAEQSTAPPKKPSFDTMVAAKKGDKQAQRQIDIYFAHRAAVNNNGFDSKAHLTTSDEATLASLGPAGTWGGKLLGGLAKDVTGAPAGVYFLGRHPIRGGQGILNSYKQMYTHPGRMLLQHPDQFALNLLPAYGAAGKAVVAADAARATEGGLLAKAAAASKATPTKPWPVRADGTTANDPVRDQA